ncbi:GTPase [Chitinasiproducens palmae]|uniref:GTPase SAR1 family protein n=1 Tax=Chitinasiproducens palmae TaxID=1770053 RepID=A0A1H2PKS2_9BURK|nr:GTPase [Chitinasiproducens palmae]SDV47027.1 GTPase SAR1 family protein [Chitinasiproducens palmae]
MKATVSEEARFIAELNTMRVSGAPRAGDVDDLDAWFAGLRRILQSLEVAASGLREDSCLVDCIENVATLLRQSESTWLAQWHERSLANTVAGHFDDKVLLLVYGKFNAGKSSFCNFLAERFLSRGESVSFFRFDGVRAVDTEARFEEGATETTATLQGVRLGGNLVLLDTPGLHSITEDNASLTRRLTDSADGMLWLTSSASPGQVQELDALAHELRRHKPLLPVITRSDLYDEDELDGRIVKCLRNKSAENRDEQARDVKARARHKLREMAVDEALVATPVSVSSHMARQGGQTTQALTDAGFEVLFAALSALVAPAIRYKRRKSAEVRLHHLEENVVGRLRETIIPALVETQRVAEGLLLALPDRQSALANSVWRTLIPVLPEWLDEALAGGGALHVLQRVSNALDASLLDETARQLPECEVACDLPPANLRPDHGDVDGILTKYAGSAVLPADTISADFQRVHAALTELIRRRIVSLSGIAAGIFRDHVERIISESRQCIDRIEAQCDALEAVKQRLRHT